MKIREIDSDSMGRIEYDERMGAVTQRSKRNQSSEPLLLCAAYNARTHQAAFVPFEKSVHKKKRVEIRFWFVWFVFYAKTTTDPSIVARAHTTCGYFFIKIYLSFSNY